MISINIYTTLFSSASLIISIISHVIIIANLQLFIYKKYYNDYQFIHNSIYDVVKLF